MKYFFKTIFLIVIFLFAFTYYVSASYSYNDFNSFVDDINLVRKSNKNISVVKLSLDFDKIKDNKCVVSYYNNYIDVSPVCFLLTETNFNIDIDESLNYLLNDLQWFTSYYSDLNSFFYTSADPIFKESKFDLYKKYRSTIYERVVITYMEMKNTKIRITKDILSKFMFDQFSFYVVPTYMTNRANCSLTNYKLAISKLEWLKLEPWNDLNLNSLISYDTRACRWTLWNNYMFFGGSCWASTQLFRLSLLMPNLDVVERHAHSKWRAYYYWSNIMGDDAAMYENSKKFIVKNNFDTPIYFKVYEQWEFSYLVWVLPKKENSYVEINKNVLWLSSSVYKNIYVWDTLNKIYEFNSRYNTNYFGKS